MIVKNKPKEEFWISLSDLMTGLMIIFLFISIAFMRKVKEEQVQVNNIVESFKETKIALYQELKKEFETDFRSTNWNAEIDEDLSIRFLNEEVLFGYDESTLKEDFKELLNNFWPRYLKILLKDKYQKKILEVRIEGHTDSKGSFMYNVGLSQRRTKEVLNYVLYGSHSEFLKLNQNEKSFVKFWLVANGYSSGRTLDEDGNFTMNSHNQENRQKSRRVEFRIVTKSDEVLNQIKDLIEKQNESI